MGEKRIWTRPSSAALVMAWLMWSAVSLASPLEDVRGCLESNIPQTSSALTVEMRSRDRAGRTYTHEARVYWKRSDGLSKSAMCMLSPADVRGLTYVVHHSASGHAVWVYLPDQGRVVRIQSGEAARLGHIARTAMSYDDIQYLPLNLSSAVQHRDPDTALDGRTVSVVRLALPRESRSGYEHVILFVDPESCVPLETDFRGPGERLLKVARADPDTIQRENGIRFARSIRLRDLDREVETELVVRDAKINTDLPDRLFEPRSQRGICPR